MKIEGERVSTAHRFTCRLPVLVALVAAAILLVSSPALADTFVVKNERDQGRDSLRAVVKAANKSRGKM